MKNKCVQNNFLDQNLTETDKFRKPFESNF